MIESGQRVAIVGAGVAGLVCARALSDIGVDVTLYDKGYKPGGRLATRRTPLGHFVDHGAQYMTAVEHRFRQAIATWHAAGWVEPWNAHVIRIEQDGQITNRTRTHWVAVPDMNSLAQQLGAGLRIHSGATVTSLTKRCGSWWLSGTHDNEGPFTDVLLGIPAPQAITLLQPHQPSFFSDLLTVEMMPCWAVMVAFERTPEIPYDAAHIIGRSPLGWIANNGSKPNRQTELCWVLHANARWSAEHLEVDPDWVAATLIEEWQTQLGHALPPATEVVAHRWRYARATKPLGRASAYDPNMRIGVAGDWCLNQKVEAAYLSGWDLAECVMKNIPDQRRPQTRQASIQRIVDTHRET